MFGMCAQDPWTRLTAWICGRDSQTRWVDSIQGHNFRNAIGGQDVLMTL